MLECAVRRLLLGGVLGCFLLGGAESAPCASSGVVELTVDSAQAASTVVETVSCTGGVFSVEWVGNIALPGAFNISGGTVLTVYGGSGSSEEDVIDGALATQLFSVSDAELNLEGVTLTGGFVESADENVYFETSIGNIDANPGGGAVSATDSVVTVTDCVVAGNVAENGGAFWLMASHLGLSGMTAFTDNDAEAMGGVIFAVANATITVEGEADFSRNTGSDALDIGSGGAIRFAASCSLDIPGKALFHGNSAGLGGALAWWIESSFNVTGEVEFSDNAANTGGAINCEAEESVTSLVLDGRANFFNNTASNNGGAISMGGSVSIGGEVNFTENSAGDEGGAISGVSAGTLRFEEDAVVRFVANECGGNGGGIALLSSVGLADNGQNAQLEFVGNIASDSGGAISARTVTLLTLDGRYLFADNGAVNAGGAVHASIATNLRLTSGAEFRGNSARVGGAVVVESSGGGSSTSEGDVRLELDSASVSECRFSANVAEEDGGALHVGSGFTEVIDSVFEANIAGEEGDGNLRCSVQVFQPERPEKTMIPNQNKFAHAAVCCGWPSLTGTMKPQPQVTGGRNPIKSQSWGVGRTLSLRGLPKTTIVS